MMRMIMIMIKKTILMMMRRPDIADFEDEKDGDEDEVFDDENEDDAD